MNDVDKIDKAFLILIMQLSQLLLLVQTFARLPQQISSTTQ